MVRVSTDNAIAKKALEAIAAIDAEASRKKAEQVGGLQDALRAIDARMAELKGQRQQVEEALEKIAGKKVLAKARGPRIPRQDYQELRERLVRWMKSHAPQTYTAKELQREFPELKTFPSLVMFLKKQIEQGLVTVDKSGGPINTKYAAAA